MSSTPTRSGIHEPVLPALARVLRRAVVDLNRTETRRVFAPVLHAGFPGGDRRTLELDPTWELDATLRVDMVEAITRHHLAQGRVPLLWLTRPEDAAATLESDRAWAGATRAAGAELTVSLDLVVVTRHAWLDPRTGVGRTWRRVRERQDGAG